MTADLMPDSSPLRQIDFIEKLLSDLRLNSTWEHWQE